MDKICFLSLAEAMEIHRDQIERYGGSEGIRDTGLLSAAVNGPQQTYDGRYLHGDLLEMAAAYIYYICSDHPFIDGNKRTALASGLVFLELHGISLEDPEEILFPIIMRLASSEMDKHQIKDVLKALKI